MREGRRDEREERREKREERREKRADKREKREERRDNIGLVLSCSHAFMPSCSRALVAATWIVAAAF